ncbi:MAG TPA: diguanylate cyclase [Alphaproteobacteria bacterium]|nr:diguanylate cyclase [Alphaproteobacteria bacterium]
MDSNTRIVHGLGKVVDDHIAWLSQWHQAAFYSGEERAQRANELKIPPSFLQWHERAHHAMAGQAPVLERLSQLHDQLHTSAKLVLLKSPPDEALPIEDYEKVLGRFDEFVTAVRRLERAFSEAAAGLDPLTGLRTRTGLQEDFNREMNRFKNAGTPFVAALCDIDHFKAVNDGYGHETGDKVLVAVANALLRHIRTYDDAYRLGGEEFLLILKGLDASSAEPVLERLRAALSRTELKAPDGTPLHVTASFGFTMVKEGKSLDQHLAEADQALYRAKREGRNRVVKA